MSNHTHSILEKIRRDWLYIVSTLWVEVIISLFELMVWFICWDLLLKFWGIRVFKDDEINGQQLVDWSLTLWLCLSFVVFDNFWFIVNSFIFVSKIKSNTYYVCMYYVFMIQFKYLLVLLLSLIFSVNWLFINFLYGKNTSHEQFTNIVQQFF